MLIIAESNSKKQQSLQQNIKYTVLTKYLQVTKKAEIHT